MRLQHPVRRSSMYRQTMSQLEIRACIPGHVQLNLSRVLSPIQQSMTESVSTAHMSQHWRSSSMSLRRSVSALPPEDGPHNTRQGNDTIANAAPQSVRTVSCVDESFSSLTLPSPTTLVSRFAWLCILLAVL